MARRKNESTSTGHGKREVVSSRATGSVTLDDVARLVGVSPITVSRALNYPDKVAPKTLDKINQAITRTGYVPNLLAGGLASKKSRLIAAIVPSMANSVYAETVRLFSDTLREAGYQVLLGESGHHDSQEESLVSAVLSRRPDGIYLTGVNHSLNCRRVLLSANVPVVETWDLTPTPLDIVIGFSHDKVGAAVANYLLGKGYTKIGIVSGDDHRATIRKQAFLDTLAAHGVKADVALAIPPTTFQLGRQGMAELLDRGFRDGVVFFSSDTLAQGALAEIQSRGLSVPGDIALMGFGDQPYAAHMYPALSTVKFDRRMIGLRAAQALLARINGESVPDDVVDVGFSIVERETT